MLKPRNWRNRFSMKSPAEIKQLAVERLSEAQILCDNEKYDGAFYLAGYSIELMLKAKVCEHFGVDNLFDEDATDQDVNELKNAVKTHDIRKLLVFSGLRNKFEKAKAEQNENGLRLMQTHTYLFSKQPKKNRCLWNEQVRYQAIGSQKAETVRELIELLLHPEGLLQWINKN